MPPLPQADIYDVQDAKRELRDADERTRSIVDHVLDGIITIDERGDIASFNRAAEKMFGYQVSEVLSRNVRMLMPEPYYSEHDAYIANYLRTGVAKIIGTGREVTGKRKDDSTFPMELAVSEFHLGENRYFTGIVRDITERKRLQDELQQRVHDLAETDRQKNEFLAMLSHELRNPLAPMRNALMLLKREQLSADARAEIHGVMERQLQQMVRLVDDLLDVSRIIRGKIDLRWEELELSTIVQRAIETAQPVIEANGQSLSVALPEQPLLIRGDAVRLAQAISNLLTNAAKYSRSATPIELAARVEHDHAIITVKDRGVGIPVHLVPRLFDLFVQGEHTIARTQGGLGIGLTLVKRIVELHHGWVHAYSAGPGQGSEFTLQLPALASPSRNANASAAPEPNSGPSRRVLVVDDNVDAAETIAMILRLSGHQVLCAYDGRAALARVNEYKPDIILLDIGLPEVDGYEVARRIRSTASLRDVRIVAISGYGQDEDRRRSHDAGIDHHLTKPVDLDALRSFVETRSAWLGHAH
jgi:PAS domain S-box-containing protein